MSIKPLRIIERWRQALQSLLVDWGEEPEDKQLDESLRSIGTQDYSHAHGKSLYTHLTGTKNILRVWSQPFWIQAAGLFHSVYSTDIYQHKVLDTKQREQLKSIIGSKAERLVYLFCNIPRQKFFEKISESSTTSEQLLTLPAEISGEQVELAVNSSEVFGLIVLHMANEAEQCCLSDGKPGMWLARVNALGNQMLRFQGKIPPVFNDCKESFSSGNELRLRESYDEGLKELCSDHAESIARFEECSQFCEWIAEPFIFQAYIRALNGDVESARKLSIKALNILDQWGTPWDKRLSWEEWKDLAEIFLNKVEFEQIGKIPHAFVDNPRILLNRMRTNSQTSSSLVSTLTAKKPQSISIDNISSQVVKHKRLESYINSFASNKSDLRKAIYPDLPSQPWYNSQSLPIVRDLEESFKKIREEIMQLQNKDFHSESEKIARKGQWDVFFFYERGKKNVENCSRCPTITRIIEQHETIRSHAGLIYVSRMQAGTHIAPHRGPTNLRLRCHLGIQIPDGNCGLRVGNQIGEWKQGQCIVFDDFYEHEAWNETTEDRIVLIIDLWHPELTPYEREVLKGIHLYAFVLAQSLQKYWNSNEKAKSINEYH